jgi:hypothetical protein
MTDLQPPAAADIPVPAPTALELRVGRMKTNGNSQYNDGTRTYQRVSNLLKNLETDTYHLDLWKQRQVAIGMSKRPDLVLGVAAATQIDPTTGKLTPAAKAEINGLCKQASDAAASKAGANQGTAVHTATERLDLGETLEQIGLPYPYDADLRAYDVLSRAMGLRFRAEHVERSVRTDVDGTLVVGTYDRFGESEWLTQQGFLAPGEGLIVDVKTEGDPLLNLLHIGPQLAIYANAHEQFCPEPTEDQPYAGRYEPMPNVSKAIGLIIHVRNGRATPYLVDLTAGWEAARGAEAQRRRVAAAKTKLGEPGCWAIPLDVPMPAATEIVAQSHERELTQRLIPTPEIPSPAPEAVVQQAVRNPDGTTTWHVVESPAPVPPGPQPLEAMLWEAIQAASSLDELAALFERATATGVAWEGPIAEAGIVRAAIVRCAQRAMHDPATTGKCACGWARGMAS